MFQIDLSISSMDKKGICNIHVYASGNNKTKKCVSSTDADAVMETANIAFKDMLLKITRKKLGKFTNEPEGIRLPAGKSQTMNLNM